MTVSIRVDPETGVAIASASGTLGLEDARESVARLWKTPGWSGESVVWDFRKARFELSSSEIREMAQFVIGRQPARPPARVAFVTPRDVDFGLSRMFEAYRDDPRTEFGVFRDYDEALDWARSGGAAGG